MPYLRKANERGLTKLDWLQSYHSFSFGDCQDHKHISFSLMRVINDDIIKPNSGFDFHSHDNMEIITYLIKGKVMHRDNLGNEEVLSAPQVQVMSAGSGITHSEVNPSNNEELKLLQIWIKPKKINIKPFYEQKVIKQKGILTQLVAPRENNNHYSNCLTINQDASLHRLVLQKDEIFDMKIKNKLYLHLIKGEAIITNPDYQLLAGDGLGVSQDENIKNLNIKANQAVEALVFELP